MKSLTKLSVLSRGVTLLVAGLCLVSSVQAQETKIGFISTDRVFREAAPYKAAQVKLEQEFAKRQKDLQDLGVRLKAMADKFDKDAPVMSDSERAKRQRELAEADTDFQRKQREFKEDLNQRRNEETANAIDRTNKVIKQIAEADKYDIILQEAAYVSPRIDITDKVIKALSK